MVRTFIKKATEKSFEKGLLWGIFAGYLSGCVTIYAFHSYEYTELQRKYYSLKEQHFHERYFTQRACCGVHQDGVNELR